jgi:hypothetical protein
MSWMLLVALALLCWASLPGKAEVLTLSCDGTMKEEEQQKPHAINKMRLIVNFDVRTVTGFTGIIASYQGHHYPSFGYRMDRPWHHDESQVRLVRT